MRHTFFLFVIFFFSTKLLGEPLSEIKTESEIIFLMNVDNGKVLIEKNADVVTPPASITKIATALYALKEVQNDLDIKIEADQDCIGSITAEMQKSMNYKHPPHWLIVGGTHMSISKGSKLSLEELLYGLMLISGNDCANIIAKYVSGSISQFMVDLNDYLESIGCTHTHFCNPHGLHLPNHKTTARDMAIITKEALKYPIFKEIISTEKYLRPSLKNHKDGWILNSNLLIRKNQRFFYPSAIGGKTGIHQEAKNSLVALASSRGRNLLVVLMQCPTKEGLFSDAKKLFETAFTESAITEVYLKKGSSPFKQVVEGASAPLKTYLKEDICLTYYPAEKPQVKGEIHWMNKKLPIRKGEIVADLIFKDDAGTLLKKTQLYAQKKMVKKLTLSQIVFTLLTTIVVLLGVLIVYIIKADQKV